MPIRKENKDTKPIGYRARKEAERRNNPKNGDTTIKEGHKFVFKDGNWVKAPKQGNHVSRFASARDKAHAEAKKITGESKPSPAPSRSSSKPPAPKPKPTATKPAAKPAAKPSPKSDAGMKNQDKNYRGNLFEKTFGYKKGDAPDQRAKKTASEKPDVGYKTSTKVDKNYADKKPSNTTSNAYDKGVNLNPAKPSSPNEKKKKSASQNLAEAIRKRRTHT